MALDCICVGEGTSIDSGNGLLPVRCQAIIKIQNCSFLKIHLKMMSAKWWPFCPGGDELKKFLAMAQNTMAADNLAPYALVSMI